MMLTSLEGRKFLALRPDHFTKVKPIEEVVKEAMEEKKEVEIIIEPEPEPVVIPEPEPTEEELAEIEKEKKKAELQAQLDALG